MLKRDKILDELKELHRRFYHTGFCSLSLEQYEAEVKRLRFKWVVDYDRD